MEDGFQFIRSSRIPQKTFLDYLIFQIYLDFSHFPDLEIKYDPFLS